jgi:hypothetical protein
MCRLHNEGRDHIWGYFVRNMARPMWLAREANRVDLLLGNPPWLAYRHMPEDMQAAFRSLSERRLIWAGREVATHQDLSALFVVRAAELYLRNGGRVAMVLPNAAVDREQYARFRTGHYSEPIGSAALAFEGSWDLRRIRPHFFPRGASVVFARRSRDPVALGEDAVIWSGRLSRHNSPWSRARHELTRTEGRVHRIAGEPRSPFGPRFTQGATFAPRFLFLVNERAAGPLGLPGGRVAVASSRSNNEKAPYNDLPDLEGVIESEFVRPIYSGENLLPYRVGAPLQAVIPCSSSQLLSAREIELHPGLSHWWSRAEAIWEANRSSTRLSLAEQLNYQSKLTKQLPIPPFRVVYNASGMHLAAAKVRNERAVITKSLYWAAFRDESEADYLCAILNCSTTTEMLRPYMSYGKDERHVDKHLWELPVPAFDPTSPLHAELVELGRQAADVAHGVAVDPTVHFATSRRAIRQAIENTEPGRRIAEIVFELLS